MGNILGKIVMCELNLFLSNLEYFYFVIVIFPPNFIKLCKEASGRSL